jgi:hypothetical protein
MLFVKIGDYEEKPASDVVKYTFSQAKMKAAVLTSNPKSYACTLLMIFLADLSIVYCKPEWTISFSEAPLMLAAKAVFGTTLTSPPKLSVTDCNKAKVV